jgi:hypothetical protein
VLLPAVVGRGDEVEVRDNACVCWLVELKIGSSYVGIHMFGLSRFEKGLY